MAQSVDITSLDLFSTELIDSNGHRDTLFELTCNKHKNWTDPAVANTIFNVPDQVLEINNRRFVSEEKNNYIYGSLRDFKKSMVDKVGLKTLFEYNKKG